MSRARHHHKHEHAKGGAVGDRPGSGSREHEIVAGNPDVLKEAEEEHGSRKHGGRAKRHHRKHGGHVEGHHKKHHMGRPGRKRGGAVGANDKPLSTAHVGSHPGGETPRSGDTYGGTPSD